MITAALLQQLGNGRMEAEVKSLAQSLRRRGVPVQFILEKQVQRRQLKLEPATLVAGHIPLVLSALRQLGIDPPAPNDYPESLRPCMHRRTWRSTVKDLVAAIHAGIPTPFFAKPLGRHKRFRGHVFESWDDLRELGGASEQTPVACSELVDWTTEYRVFVLRGTIIGIRHYQGDPETTLDRLRVDDAVARFEASGEATAGYGIDFGVLSTGQTALVEVNDGYSLGAYGLDDDLYTDLIVARWLQLTDVIT